MFIGKLLKGQHPYFMENNYVVFFSAKKVRECNHAIF